MEPPKAGSGVRLDVDGVVARIVLDRPERHNALEASDIATLRDHLDRVDADPSVRVLVVTGAGPTFCSGASLDQMRSGELTGELFETLTDRLAAVGAPTVCALNGSVFGGGAEVALCCDFRVGVTGSRMAVPAARLGVCYPPGGLRRYADRLGLATATRILVANETLAAEEMLRVGYLTALVDAADLASATQALVDRLAAAAPLAVRAMKRVLNGLVAGDLEPGEAERLAAACATSDDLREGLAAAVERREPSFRGR